MNSQALPAIFRATPAAMIGYEALLDGLGDRDRASMERQHQVHESKLGAASAQRWRQLACILRTLATGPVKLIGSNAMQFFIPDGKYRKQVFALQVLADGALVVYAPDVLPQALQAGLLSGHNPTQEDNTYHLAEPGETLAIDALDAKTPGPDALYKDLTGWNRRAMRMTLPPRPSDAQVMAARELCVLAATEWSAPLS